MQSSPKRPDPDAQEEQDVCGDVAATSTAAAAATKPKLKQRRRKKSSLGRHTKGQQKQSKTHDLPLPPSVPSSHASNNDTSDPRVWNLKRAIGRRDNRITTTKTQHDESVAENKQLLKKLKTAKAETKAVKKEAENQMDVLMKDMEHKVKVINESANKQSERAEKKMKIAAEASGNAKVKAATATKAISEAKEKAKDATRAQASFTKATKHVNKKAGSKASAAATKLKKKDDKVDELKQQLKEALKEKATAERRARDAEEEALKQKALREELEIALGDMERNAEGLLAMKKAGQIVIRKESAEGTGFKKWSQQMVQLIMEYLVAGGPPTAFSKILVATIRTMQPDAVIDELPGVWFVRRCRTVLLIVCQLLSAYRLAKAEKWGQLNCDATQRHQSSYLNLVVSCVEEYCADLPEEQQQYVSILMSACILPEDESAEAQKEAIVEFLNDKNEWLDEWATKIEKDFPDFKHDIKRDGLTLSKLAKGGLVTQDTCNTASKGSDLIVEEIKASAAAAGINANDVLTFKTYCHHHCFRPFGTRQSIRRMPRGGDWQRRRLS